MGAWDYLSSSSSSSSSGTHGGSQRPRAPPESSNMEGQPKSYPPNQIPLPPLSSGKAPGPGSETWRLPRQPTVCSVLYKHPSRGVFVIAQDGSPGPPFETGEEPSLTFTASGIQPKAHQTPKPDCRHPGADVTRVPEGKACLHGASCLCLLPTIPL